MQGQIEVEKQGLTPFRLCQKDISRPTLLPSHIPTQNCYFERKRHCKWKEDRLERKRHCFFRKLDRMINCSLSLHTQYQDMLMITICHQNKCQLLCRIEAQELESPWERYTTTVRMQGKCIMDKYEDKKREKLKSCYLRNSKYRSILLTSMKLQFVMTIKI
jgi:hypothetical protein